MKTKTKYISTKTISKNKLLKNKVIINPDNFYEKLSSILETENETIQSNIQCNQMFKILFDENKFKIRNDFDREHSKVFLDEKDKCLQPINLDNSFSDDDKIETINRISSKFTFGQH